MGAVLVAVLSFAGFIVAYHTYGRWLGRKIFGLDPKALPPSEELRDGVDYVPTRKQVLFGHHFTSIAGTGPIVGPAIAVFWGWLPALLWVVFGSIFIGAVHDFGSLVVSIRARGQTIGDAAARLIDPRARLLMFAILFLVLMVVIAIFGLVIAIIFSFYPQSVLSVWVAMPLAVALGIWLYKRQGGLFAASLLMLGLVYLAVAIGVYALPIDLADAGLGLYGPKGAGFFAGLQSSVVVWTVILLVYAFIASILPVWLLLQPRDYINSHQLFVALGLLLLGLFVARPEFAADAVVVGEVAGAPPLLPFLFITVACGAVSGFHCLVSSGTSSKQLRTEPDAQFVGYGGMLMEGALAVLVIVACAAGLGMGVVDDGVTLTGGEAWRAYYGGNWAELTLPKKVGAFVEGSANMIAALGVPHELAIGVIATMVACFAATTLDTATRLQRYVIQELGGVLKRPALTNKYTATALAVVTGGALALYPGPHGPGSGGLILWPLFGAINQLLAGLAFLVLAFYLLRHSKPVWFVLGPLALMVVMPAWAMISNIVKWTATGQWLLVCFGVGIELLQAWMVYEGVVMWRKARGTPPAPLPPRPASVRAVRDKAAG